MSHKIQNKTCLVISYGPVPTPKYQKIEGGGMRCWGLALGLTANGYDVTVAVNNGFPVDITKTKEGVHLLNWQEDAKFAELINSYDSVIISYSMGGPTSFVIDYISDHVTLILDCYVPIYIEVSARNSADKTLEYTNYRTDIMHYNKALKRGDYFLCANVPQKHMYMGVLSALGVINPYSYEKERVLLVPFGVESTLNINNSHNPYHELGIKKDDFTLLWFGGLYPWFNIEPLLEVIKDLSIKQPKLKFVIVGGKNPYNNHPDFIRQYEVARKYAENNNLIDKAILFVDWVDFNDRINWYQHADVVISINNIGEENIYSWRTRVMDYVWGEIPMITNGGDPLSDELIATESAIKLKDLEKKTIYDTIENLLNNKKALSAYKKNLLSVKSKYHWEKTVEALDEQLKKDDRPYLDEKEFSYKLGFINNSTPDTSRIVKIKRLARMPYKVLRKMKQKGVKRSLLFGIDTVINRTKKTVSSHGKRFFFLSHPLDFTGAPLVLLDVVEDFTEQISPKNISVVYPGGEKTLIRRVHGLHVIPEKMVMGIGSRVIHAQLGIKKDDFVLMNTVALYPNYRDYILGLLDSGRLTKATWFIHEDKPEIRFDDKGLVKRIKKLVRQGVLDIIVPSQQTADEYNIFFETDTVKPVVLRVAVPTQYENKRDKNDFDKLRFVISGTPSDGRKGQLLAISAFSKYLNEYQSKNPSLYRDFELHLISIGKDDYISQQIKSIGDGLLGDRVAYYPKVPKEEAMRITALCNATICCSLNETFALFVAEGMLMGHVLLRNYSSGHQEQIQDGVNGYLIDHSDVTDFAEKIELLLNKKRTTNEALLKMSDASKKIAKAFSGSNYFNQINK